MHSTFPLRRISLGCDFHTPGRMDLLHCFVVCHTARMSTSLSSTSIQPIFLHPFSAHSRDRCTRRPWMAWTALHKAMAILVRRTSTSFVECSMNDTDVCAVCVLDVSRRTHVVDVFDSQANFVVERMANSMVVDACRKCDKRRPCGSGRCRSLDRHVQLHGRQEDGETYESWITRWAR